MADDLAQFWENLKSGKDCVTEIPSERWSTQSLNDGKRKTGKTLGKWGGFISDVDKFDSLFFNISPKEAKIIDPQERLFLETVWHTIEDAGYTREQLENNQVGVFVGAMYAHYQLFSVEAAYRGTGFTPSSLHASIANRVSYVFNFRGPSIALDTMCSSSLTAVHLACASLHQGECEVAIAGGVNLSIHPNKYLALSEGSFASSDGRCRSFGEGGDGYVPGEGVGAVLLKPLSKAIADGDHIYGVIKGSAINHGGKTNGYTVPNPVAQGEVIAEALRKSKLDPRKLSYLEAHGTGTSLGDPIEITGLVKAFHAVTGAERAGENQYCPIGSVKSNIGHLESAAGIASITKVLLQMKHGQLVPSLHSGSLNPHINFQQTPFYVQRTLETWKQPVIQENGAEKTYPRQAGISSFGAGGSNAHLVIEEYRQTKAQIESPDKTPQLVTLSAGSAERLKVYARKIAGFISKASRSCESTLSTSTEITEQLILDLLTIAGDVLQLNPQEIDPDEELGEYGIDQVCLAELSARVNQRYNIETTPALLNKLSSFRAFARQLNEQFGEPVSRYYRGNLPAVQTDSAYELNLADFAYTLQIGREAMEERLALVVSSLEELCEKLARYAQGETDIEGLCLGNVRLGKSRPELLLEGREGAEFIQTVIAQQKWRKLAQLWVMGVEVEWQLLHRHADGSRQERQRLSLPTYPFARIPHWLPEAVAAQPESNKSLHPLLDGIDSRQSFRQRRSLVFRKTLCDDEPLLKDHKVLGRAILPGVGYLEMAHAALSQVENADSFNLSRVVLLKSLAVTGKQEVQIVLREENQLLHFEIQSGDETTDANLITHARGEFRRHASSLEDLVPQVSIDEIKARCGHEIQKEELYAQFKAIGIEYGAYYQRVERIWGGDEEALGLLNLPREYQSELNTHTIHPTILDGALHVIAGVAINRAERDELVLPFAIEEVKILRPLTAQAYAHVRLIEKDRYQITVLDEQGQACIVLNELALRKVKAKETQAKETLPEFFYLPGWKFAPLATAQMDLAETHKRHSELPTVKTKKTVLLFHPPQLSGLEKPLAEAQADDEFLSVSLGAQTRRLADNRWEIDTRDAVNLDRWLEQFPSLESLYFLGGIQTGETNVADASALEQSQELGVLTLFRLVKSLVRLGLHRRSLELKVVTNDAHQVLPGETIKPYAASLFGFVKSLAKEYPQWAISSIDISLSETTGATSRDSSDFAALVKSITAEPAHPKGDETALRRGRRYVRTLTPIHLPPVEQPPFREKGVYLILGGARGIGLELSKHLARSVKARLVLIGRSQLSVPQQTGIAHLEALGAEVLYLRADASSLEQMQHAVQEATNRFGRINGVIHSALVLRDMTLEQMTEEQLRSALSPKVEGSVNLYRAVEGQELDFMLFFSSGQSFSGNAGQANYAAGCTFKDAFAGYVRGQQSYQVKVINWGYWGEVGAVASEEYRRRLAAQGVGSISVAEGIDAIGRVLAHPINQVIPVKLDEHLREPMGIDVQYRVSLHPASNPSVTTGAMQRIAELAEDEQPLQGEEPAFAAVAQLGQDLLLSSFQKMGVFKNAGETYEKENLKARLRLAPDYFRLFDALLDILVKAEFIGMEGANITATQKLENKELEERLRTLEERKQQLSESFPEVASHVNLLWTCAQRYPAILTGEVRATDVIFPNSSMELVEGVYRGNAAADRCNQQVAQSVESYIQTRLPHLAANEQIKILEVGAGTGGTSAGVLRSIHPYAEQVKYVYTDLSAGFTRHGTKQFGAQHPFVEFKVLNIENEVRAQGYLPGDFDLIIGANVLHATRDMRNTLRNIKLLLKTNGWLVLNEVTEVQDYTTLTFGLLEGWWLYVDSEIRLQGAPLLSLNLWETLLKEEGFKEVHTAGRARRDEPQPGQHVIIAESNGQVIQRQSSSSAKERLVAVPATQAAVQQRLVKATAAHAVAVTTPERDKQQSQLSEQTVVAQHSGQTFITNNGADNELTSEALLHDIEQNITDCVAEALAMLPEEIDRERQFSEYGVDSIIGVDLINVINSSLGITLRTTALFDYGNVKELAQFICAEHGTLLRRADVEQPASSLAISEELPDVQETESDDDLTVLEKLASGELSAEHVYQMMETNYGHL